MGAWWTAPRRLSTYAAGLLVLLGFVAGALAACSTGDAAQANSQRASAFATSRASPAATPAPGKALTTLADALLTRIPPAARRETMTGAEAFARYYVGQINRAYTEADPRQLIGLSTKGCRNCEDFVATATRFRTSGLHHAKSSLVVQSATASVFTGRQRQVTAFVDQRSVDVMDEHGAVRGRTHAAQGAFVITLEYQRHWRVARLQTAKS